MKIKFISPNNSLLLALLSALSASAETIVAQQAINITVDVEPVCELSLNVTNIALPTLMVGQTSSAGTTLTVNCTPETSATVSVSSINNWNLHGARYSALIPYAFSYTGGGYTTGAIIVPTWSNQVTGTNVMTGTATGTPWQIPLEISVQGITNQTKVDSYSDTITIDVSY